MEIRSYGNEDEKKNEAEAAREMMREEVAMDDDYSIKLKYSEKSIEPTTNE